ARKTDGSPAVRVGDGSAFALSPDNRWALAVFHSSDNHQLGLLPVGAGQSRLLPRDNVRYQLGGVFLPDGKGVLVVGSEPGKGMRLFSRSLEGGAPRAVMPADVRAAFTGLSVSPDGKSATVVTGDGTPVIVDLESGQSRPIPGLAAGEVPIQWSADGGAVFVARLQRLPAKIFRLDLATGARAPWKEITPSDPAGVFGIDPIRLTPDGKAYVYSYRRLLSDLYLMEGLK